MRTKSRGQNHEAVNSVMLFNYKVWMRAVYKGERGQGFSFFYLSFSLNLLVYSDIRRLKKEVAGMSSR